jgi:hypothetical protein
VRRFWCRYMAHVPLHGVLVATSLDRARRPAVACNTVQALG